MLFKKRCRDIPCSRANCLRKSILDNIIYENLLTIELKIILEGMEKEDLKEN
jgi:hypothetical protein